MSVCNALAGLSRNRGCPHFVLVRRTRATCENAVAFRKLVGTWRHAFLVGFPRHGESMKLHRVQESQAGTFATIVLDSACCQVRNCFASFRAFMVQSQSYQHESRKNSSLSIGF